MTNDTHLDLTSHSLPADKTAELLRLFPEIRTEGDKIDFDKLRLVLGESIDIGRERYGMTWPGKAECFKTIQTPSMGTLLPAPAESVDFDTTENLIIEGDNLEALKLLQKAYLGKVKMIYIDPPYNTGNDFIYPDNYTESLQTYLEYTKQVDAEGRKFGTNSDTDGRFHSRWLNMMYPRLYLARNLLQDDGVIFVSIDDNEVHNLRLLMNDVFGEESFIAVFPWRKRTAKSDVPFGVSQDFEWIIAYAKDKFEASRVTERKYYHSDDYTEGWRLSDLTTQRNKDERPNSNFVMVNPRNGQEFPANPKRIWGVSKDTVNDYLKRGKIVFPGDYDFLNISTPTYRVFESEDHEKSIKKYGLGEARSPISTLLPENIGRTEDGTKEIDNLFSEKIFAFPKPSSLINHLIGFNLEKDSIILDFFAGSGTTAHAILNLNKEDNGNRKFILVQLPEPTNRKDYPTIADITKERVRRVIKKMNDEEAGQLPFTNHPQDRGFRVFKLAESNFKAWDASAPKDGGSLEKQLELHIEHIREGRTSEDILYEILFKSGFALTTKIETLRVSPDNKLVNEQDDSVNQNEGQTKKTLRVFSVANGSMLICLEKELTLEAIRAMAEMKPQRVVCLDLGFTGNDQLKTNAVQIFKNKEIVFKTV